MIPSSVAIKNLLPGAVVAKWRIERVEPTWAAYLRMPSGHSGWAATSASGYCAFKRSISRSENCSWTMQVPCHSVIGRPVFWTRKARSEEHTSELQSRVDLVCRLLLE